MLWLGVAALFVGALVVGWNFGAANATTIDIDLLWVTIGQVTIWQLVLASFLLGASAVGLVASFLGTRGWMLRHRYRRAIRKLESELHQLRSLPLAEAREPTGGAPNVPAPSDASASPDRSA